MTEEEAKTKACGNTTPRRAWNWKQFRFVTEFRGCLGSRCMAWRWDYEFGLPDEKPAQRNSGYCGLAGEQP